MASGELGSDFVHIFETHVDAIRAYCLRRLPVDGANDAVSDVFLVAWRRRADMPTGTELRPWLFGVARNVVRTAQRSSRRVSRLRGRIAQVEDTTALDADAEIVERSAGSDVRHALTQLRDDDREILTLRAWERLTAHEISVVLDISLSAAEKRLSRALSRLRQVLDVKEEK